MKLANRRTALAIIAVVCLSALDAICLRCLAKRPEGRYASAGELAQELEAFLEGGGRARARGGIALRVGVWLATVALGGGLLGGALRASSGAQGELERAEAATLDARSHLMRGHAALHSRRIEDARAEY